ncbi:kinase-like protein [Xylona heveae TC161]|uniref:non-specific serine/threonine protein kinase n=1 Tax=Xylona heveae (strain CBS 132557 / TC161) TaxID=1328760 RepID=A0A165JFH3_XYLHT|nr:kinase-like protein [Xylona heveae TC161]KZF26168.1 kinase-like protein [Xylona heveae TC161]
MADPEYQRSMSLVPYTGGGEIVLRHNDSVVVYDPQSQHLVLRDASHELINCPYCDRPLRDDPRSSSQHGANSDIGASFVNPDYFRMLHHSTPGSEAEVSRPASSYGPLDDPTGSSFTGSEEPPANSEFLGSAPTTSSSTHGISSAAFSPNYFDRFFVEEGVLGRGGKGVVLLVRHVLDGVSLGNFACKRVPVGDDHEWLEKVLIEVQLLQHLSHQNLVSYRHVWLEDVKLTNFGPSVPCAFILQQYCNGGDLHQYILKPHPSNDTSSAAQKLKDRLRRRSKGQVEPLEESSGPRKLTFEEIYSFFKDITSGLHHLHANGYIHRDLKPSNCLLHKTGKETRVLLSDFGEVQIENAARRSTGATGTISYCAPEVLRPEGPDGTLGNFTTKSDIFSLGMILHFMCFGCLPYKNADDINEENEDLDQLRAEISIWPGFDDVKGRMRSDLPEKLYKVLKSLLAFNPADRPSAEEVLNGIRTGGTIDENGAAGFGHSAPSPSSSVIDNLRSVPRITRVDSPAPGAARNNVNGMGNATPARFAQHPNSIVAASSSLAPVPRPVTRASNLRSSTLLDDVNNSNNNDNNRESSFDNNGYGTNGTINQPSNQSVDQKPDHHPSSIDGASSGSSLILRTRRVNRPFTPTRSINSNGSTTSSARLSPHPSPSEQQPSLNGQHIHHQHGNFDIYLHHDRQHERRLSLHPQLMPPPTLPSRIHSAFRQLGGPSTWTLAKVVLLVFKIMTIARPCSPFAANPWVLYPLICLAAVDVALGRSEGAHDGGSRPAYGQWQRSSIRVRVLVSFILLALHLGVLLLAARWDTLCIVHGRDREWVNI